MTEYPYGADYGWLACDSEGHVAIFTNAGAGPIPLATVAARPTADDGEYWVSELPIREDRNSSPGMDTGGGLEFYETFARRGVYAYDWQDVHRSKSARTNRYEIMARPSSPVRVDELPEPVATLARLARFERFRFSEATSIAVPDHLECWPV